MRRIETRGPEAEMFGRFNKLWTANSISRRTTIRLYEAFVMPVLMYGSEYRSFLKENERKLLIADTYWLRK